MLETTGSVMFTECQNIYDDNNNNKRCETDVRFTVSVGGSGRSVCERAKTLTGRTRGISAAENNTKSLQGSTLRFLRHCVVVKNPII